MGQGVEQTVIIWRRPIAIALRNAQRIENAFGRIWNERLRDNREQHNQVEACPNPDGGGVSCHTDPGGGWDWDYFMELVAAGGSVIDNRNGGLRRSNGVINDLQKTSVEDRLEQIKSVEVDHRTEEVNVTTWDGIDGWDEKLKKRAFKEGLEIYLKK